MKKDNLNPLQEFKDMSNVDILTTSSFSNLYPWYYSDKTARLKEDILTKMDKLNESKFNTFLMHLRDEIAEYYIYDTNESLIPKTIERFGIKESDFPPFHNKEFEEFVEIIHPYNKEVFTDYLIQKEIHLYAAHKEADKILTFIDGMIEDPHSESSDSKGQSINKYPRIFIDGKAYEFFKKLQDEFDGTKNILANFSFVFHRMKKDGLIFDHLKQLEFINFLSELNINIDRIKPQSQMGNEDFRESIYNRLKLK
jgi:hypothetical protein